MIKKMIKILVLLGLFLFYSGGVFTLGVYLGNTSKTETSVSVVPSFTSIDIFNVVNQHRSKLGLQPLKLDEHACHFVIERYFALQASDVLKEGHPGFDDFAFELAKESPYINVGEIYTFANSPEDSIKNWQNSPAHRFILEGPKYNAGCTYSDKGASIVILLELP